MAANHHRVRIVKGKLFRNQNIINYLKIIFSLPEPASSTKCDDDQSVEPMNRDQMVYEMFSKRFEELFQEKCKAESKVINYVTEVGVININY